MLDSDYNYGGKGVCKTFMLLHNKVV